MPKVNCAVINCTNSSYQLKKWSQEKCEDHSHNGSEEIKRENCVSCEAPYMFHCFPSILRNSEIRTSWIKAMKRENKNKSQWQPKNSDRVCSVHFENYDGSAPNAVPTLYLGYENTAPTLKTRRTLFKHPAVPRKKRKLNTGNTSNEITQPESVELTENIVETSENTENSLLEESNVDVDNLETINDDISITSSFLEHSYCSSSSKVQCRACVDKSNVIDSLVQRANRLTAENLRLKARLRDKLFNKEKNATYTWRNIKSDAKMNFYTGINTIVIFNTLFLLIQPYLPAVKYWKGPQYARQNIKNRQFKSQRKLTQRDEFLLTLMRLRLGLLNEDLADRFGISQGKCSYIFTTWIKLLSQLFGNSLVAWLPRESIRDNLPKLFRKTGNSKCRVIIDCAEVFMDRPKSLDCQAATWSDYKHHNTIKFLVGISPSGFISFLSPCYGGRASDKFITKDSGFYDLLERDDEVMADRGFQIKIILRYCKLVVPPGARTKSQMTTAECKKTKKIANLRIHVERAINRIKFFRILKGTLPITMIQHVDDIVKVCAALCNLKYELIQSNNSDES